MATSSLKSSRLDPRDCGQAFIVSEVLDLGMKRMLGAVFVVWTLGCGDVSINADVGPGLPDALTSDTSTSDAMLGDVVGADAGPADASIMEDALEGADVGDAGMVAVMGVSLSPPAALVGRAATQALEPAFAPLEATIRSGEWSTSDDSVASVDSDGVVSGIARGSATITFVSDDGGFEAQSVITVSKGVEDWRALYDDAWEGDASRTMTQARSGGHHQEHYYLAWAFEGITSIWQATGDDAYLEQALSIVEDVIDSATPVVWNSDYLGWRGRSTADRPQNDETVANGASLWEFYLWRHVATLLRIMHQSPELRARGDYQARYDDIFAFLEEHIWDKWWERSPNRGNMYRSRTHMASHPARVGMEMFIITGEEKYNDVFENTSFRGFPSEAFAGSNLRDQLSENPDVAGAWIWSSRWEGGTRIQDTSHAGDIVGFWVTAYGNGMYWNAADMAALSVTLDEVIWTENSPIAYTANVDGTGGATRVDATFSEWISLARYDEDLQARIDEFYTSVDSVRSQRSFAMGTAALNQAYIDGGPAYPEI